MSPGGLEAHYLSYRPRSKLSIHFSLKLHTNAWNTEQKNPDLKRTRVRWLQ